MSVCGREANATAEKFFHWRGEDRSTFSRRMTRQEYEKRLAAQLPEAAKARRADVVLAHRGTKKDLGNKIKRLTQALTFIMEQSKE